MFMTLNYVSERGSIICSFVNPYEINTTKTCRIKYGYKEMCHNMTQYYNEEYSTENVVMVKLAHLPAAEYCYSVEASNGTYTIITEGTFYTGI